jgi:hypothetical protein
MNLSLDVVATSQNQFCIQVELIFFSLSVVYKFKREYITTLNVDRMLHKSSVFFCLGFGALRWLLWSYKFKWEKKTTWSMKIEGWSIFSRGIGRWCRQWLHLRQRQICIWGGYSDEASCTMNRSSSNRDMYGWRLRFE